MIIFLWKRDPKLQFDRITILLSYGKRKYYREWNFHKSGGYKKLENEFTALLQSVQYYTCTFHSDPLKKIYIETFDELLCIFSMEFKLIITYLDLWKILFILLLKNNTKIISQLETNLLRFIFPIDWKHFCIIFESILFNKTI